jgi:hypothetical protein
MGITRTKNKVQIRRIAKVVVFSSPFSDFEVLKAPNPNNRDKVKFSSNQSGNHK